jgi:pimeloyl-ACP methyl ester carboxylesterase
MTVAFVMPHSLIIPITALLLLLILSGDCLPPPSVYPVDEHIFHTVVDHYSFRPTPEKTFPLRFYVNQQHWNNASGPCFFYAGNEADIFQFVNNSGFLFEAAEEFNALVVFAEHRYYGKSIPSSGDMSFLTVEQAMADFNTLNLHIRQEWSMSPQTAFITFGGSYGGNLAMWLRLKNPNLWAGAIASSATPIKHVLRETNGFALIETEVYGNVSSLCPELVRSGWRELYEGATTKDGRVTVAKELGLCEPLPDPSAAAHIHGWVSGALETMVQYGYPYPTEFYNPVPAFPFRVACQGMLAEGTGPLGALRAAANVYYNYTGQAGQCFDFNALIMKEAARHWHRKGQRDRISHQEIRLVQEGEETIIRSMRSKQDEYIDAWGYQTCTEVYQPMPTDGKTDFEVPYTPNQTAYYADCWRRWGVQPRPNWEEMNFMGADISAGSNIFLTSGQLDPWRAAGIQEKPQGSPDSIIVRIIENGAHHLDLRAANSMDPPSVVAVRNEERDAMRQWIAQWYQTH